MRAKQSYRAIQDSTPYCGIRERGGTPMWELHNLTVLEMLQSCTCENDIILQSCETGENTHMKTNIIMQGCGRSGGHSRESDIILQSFGFFSCCCFLLQHYRPTEISSTGNSGHLPWGKPAATVSHYPSYSACWFARVFIIYWNLTWTTGSLTCVCDLSAWLYTRGGGPQLIVSSEGLLWGIESAQNFDSGNITQSACKF